jgi:hypothetical protein
VTEQDGFADTPGREATPEEEARVQALLASLRDDDVPMPDHVWSRLSAVIAEEHVAATARQISGTPTAPGGSDDAEPAAAAADALASVTVLPTPEQRARRGAPRWLLPAAAAAVVVLLAGGLIKGLGTGGSSSGGGSVTAAQASAAPSHTASAESRSNFAYTQKNLTGQISRLVSSQAPFDPAAVPGSAGGKATDSSGSGATASTSASTTENGPLASTDQPAPTSDGSIGSPSIATGTPPLLAGASLDACLAQLTGGSSTTAVAVDRGTFEGKPADIVVVPTENDPNSLDVWVLAPGCTAANADVLNFSRIARP